MKIILPIGTACFFAILMLAGFREMNPSYEPFDANSSVTIFFDNVVGNDDLKLEELTYKNGTGESFGVSQLQYFISNIKLIKPDGTEYTVPQDSSYFLVRESDPATQKMTLKIPGGEYSKLVFVLGVDSVRNTMDVSKRTGVLDPASSMDNGMYWGWNSGYIFFKIEGSSTSAPEDPAGRQKFRYHIGGFGGYSAPTINNIKVITVDLSKDVVQASPIKNTLIHLKADVQKIFDGPVKVSIAAHPSVMFSQYSTNIANNYSQMFSHYRTEN